MKKFAFILFAIMLLITSSAFAQQPTQEKPFTSAEEAKLREGTAAIIKYIRTQQGLDSTTLLGSKNIPDIVDKALDKFGGAVSAIYVNVQKAAPKVWEIMILQQYAKALSGVAGPLLTLVMIIIVYYFMRKRWTSAADVKFDDSGSGGFWTRNIVTRAIPLVSGLIVCGFLFSAIKDASLLLVNPQYYAIRDLLVLLLGSGHGM